jgi:hypothetical protein
MGYIEIAMISLIGLFLITGALWGLIRGRNRALVRFGLVAVSAILAFALRGVFANLVLSIKYQDVALRDWIINLLNESGTTLPASVETIALTLVEIIVGIVAFIVSFFAIKTITWLVVFPIIKIFVKKEFPKRMVQGMCIGLVQGLLIAFVVCVPLNGLIVHAHQLTSLEIDGEQVVQLPEEIGLDGYVESVPSNVISFGGGWFYNELSSKQTSDGLEVSVDSIVNITTTAADISAEIAVLQEKIDYLASDTTSDADVAPAIDDIGNSLISVGGKLNALKDKDKALVDAVLVDAKELVKNEDGTIDPDVEKIFNELSIDDLNLDSLGDALKEVAVYVELVRNESTAEFSRNQIDVIVDGFEENPLTMDIVLGTEGMESLVSVREQDKASFNEAIDNSTLDEDEKDALKEFFGIG